MFVAMSNLRHLDVISAQTGLSSCALNPVFIQKPRQRNGVHWNKPSVNPMKYLFFLNPFLNICMLYIWWNNLLKYIKMIFKQTSV